MKGQAKLSPAMTATQFEHGYWYAAELKAFAQSLGLTAAGKLRKDELETAIRGWLATGQWPPPVQRKLTATGAKDVAGGLRLDLPVVRYTNDAATKAFLETEAQKIAPGLQRKSGARYRLNRWREAQLAQGRTITYGDLVEQYVKLNRTEGRFAQVPHGRYINFLSDFMAAEKAATKEAALAAWHELKQLDAPKTYAAWARLRSSGTIHYEAD
jgi:hypothetical protein